MGDNVSPLTRVRQACDPCRRKKTKCPGEKPACSFCTRLNQRCSYGRPEESLRVQKDHRTDKRPDVIRSHDRVRRLEARVDQIIDAVNILVDRQTDKQLPSSDHPLATSITTPRTTSRSRSIDGDDTIEPGSRFNADDTPLPPSNVLQSLVELYAERVNPQTVSLFNLETLQYRLDNSGPVLIWSFLAMTVRYTDDPFYTGMRQPAVEYYARTARDMLFAQIAQSNGSLEVLQALCLLCLSDIADSKKVQAWLTVGVAVRLAICTYSSSLTTSRSNARKSDDYSRCFWTLFVLDKIYGTSFQSLTAVPDEGILPEKPVSVRTPSSNANMRPEGPRGVQVQEAADEGISSYCLNLISTWGQLMAFLKDIKQGQIEDAWTPNSVYQKIKSLMFRFETLLPEVHRFQNANLRERTRSEWSADYEYWSGWILAQMMYHTIHCTLNHPFIHLADVHSRQRHRSPSFLQHATDQAILHAAWIVRILELLMDRDFTIFDPFIGHLASMGATVLFFLRFSRDRALASRASKNFEVCRQFVDRMADLHPHLQHTKLKLDKLAQSTSQAIQPPKVETALLWDLLDYAASSSPSEYIAGSSGDVELNVNTQFLSPIQDNNTRLVDEPATALQDPPRQETADMPDFWTDQPFSFDMVDFSMLPDVSTLTMPQEYYMHGNL
ncbi:hypothetical protein PV10_07436 [Exophiala mesophila]|uniref:Zn(2)-C6 fungal-type domain-containing protein n=2 Tax=Exophiala mesophila TaxID=212818 RepID=A0A0D1Z7Y0_EXOME|nr:uncharacterized protein PV10_07436 [Exophiala mesophila]KIV90094.1 hypothetical protein PV10_07436 [Exophiala mesophila]